MTFRTVTLITAHISPRPLAELLQSVAQQIHPVRHIIQEDTAGEGAALTRDKALAKVDTPFTAVADDDDIILRYHIEMLLNCQQLTNSDLCYPWYTVSGGTDPFSQWAGVPWSNDHPHQVPVTWLARTEAIRAVGGFSYDWDPSQGEDPGTDSEGNRAGEDYRLILRLVKAGAKIVHLPLVTWIWNHHVVNGKIGNTMGLPSRVREIYGGAE